MKHSALYTVHGFAKDTKTSYSRVLTIATTSVERAIELAHEQWSDPALVQGAVVTKAERDDAYSVIHIDPDLLEQP